MLGRAELFFERRLAAEQTDHESTEVGRQCDRREPESVIGDVELDAHEPGPRDLENQRQRPGRAEGEKSADHSP